MARLVSQNLERQRSPFRRSRPNQAMSLGPVGPASAGSVVQSAPPAELDLDQAAMGQYWSQAVPALRIPAQAQTLGQACLLLPAAVLAGPL